MRKQAGHQQTSWVRVASRVGLALVLAGGLTGCSTQALASADPTPTKPSSVSLNRLAKEYNQAVSVQKAQDNRSAVDRTRQQLESSYGSSILPATVWENIKLNRVNSATISEMVPAMQVMKKQLQKVPGYTDSDLRREIQRQIQAGSLVDMTYSTDFIDLQRVFKVQSSLQQGQQIPGVNPQQLMGLVQQAAEKQGRSNGAQASQVLGQLLQTTVYRPAMARGVRLQGIDHAEQQVTKQMQQQMVGPGAGQ